jgi:hypothetical protein
MISQSPCTWLGLDEQPWPPDHYTLLGLEPAESDVALIEQRVLERLEKVRCHQLASPEKATELMTLMAAAFVCLTNPESKRAYDRKLGFARPEPEGNGSPGRGDSLEDFLRTWRPGQPGDTPLPKGVAGVQLNWSVLTLPPPVRSTPRPPDPAGQVTKETAVPPAAAVEAGAATPPVVPAPDAPALPDEAPEAGTEPPRVPFNARSGLGTRRGLIRRIRETRELLWVWKEVGQYLRDASRRLTRRTEAIHFIQNLTQIPELMDGFPPLLGRAGQPGYLVVALARQQNLIPTFQMLQPGQREKLAHDWEAGLDVLESHRAFLRRELRALRRQNPWGRAVRAVDAALTFHLGKVLLVLAVLALLLALVMDALVARYHGAAARLTPFGLNSPR